MRRQFRTPETVSKPSRGRPGQALVEFALVLPVAMLLLALAATGGQMLMTDISLTQAARAAAIAAAQDYAANDPVANQTTDARTAANDELGGAGSLTCAGTGVPAGCVQVTDLVAGSDPKMENNVINLVKVKVWQTIDPFVPLLNGITIEAEAVAPQ